jgi:hypothetical protein
MATATMFLVVFIIPSACACPVETRAKRHLAAQDHPALSRG